MKCAICKSGETHPGEATFTLDRKGQTFLVRQVPALVCDQCGEAYFDEEVTTRIFEQVASASGSGVDVAVMRYRAA
jgi:YgiT-type zinc finger domain-containing protein